MLVRPDFLPTEVHAALNLASVTTPFASPLGATEDDYNPPQLILTTVLRVTAAVGGTVLSGIAAPDTAHLLWLVNLATAAADLLVLTNEDAASSAVNRIVWGPVFTALPLTLTELALAQQDVSRLVLGPQAMIPLWYDLASARWRVIR